MTQFIDTDAGQAFIATADNRETSPEVMRAIASSARNAAEAEAIWNGDLEDKVWDMSGMWESATNNGLIDDETLYWRGLRLDRIVAGD
tara:strand:- start:5772 stop:6035 length:264 start_codon:yes stop_codon:yes gene_type:complete